MLTQPRIHASTPPGGQLRTRVSAYTRAPRQFLAQPPRATHKQQVSSVGLGPLHALLGLEDGHSEDFAKRYRRLVATLHPDVNRSKQATQKFQAVTQAYHILKTPELRARFERQGLRSLGPRFALLRQYLHDHTLADVGLGKKGGDLFTVVGLDLREASTGVETAVTVSAQGKCVHCKGSGVAAQQSEDCDVCHGSGDILRTRYSQTGFKALHVGACPACGGQGAKTKVLCGCCMGEGRTSMRKRVHVKVPAGMDESRVLRLKGLGNAGVAGGPSGDLVMRFQIHATPNLERRGHDLHSRLEICCTSAVLGAEVPVSSVRGLRYLDVPQGTQDGAVICLPGCGLAYAEQGLVCHGSHFFTVSLVIPDGNSMGPGALELLGQLQRLNDPAASYQHHHHQLEQQQQRRQHGKGQEEQHGQEHSQQGGESAPSAEQQQAHQTSRTDAHASQQQEQQQQQEGRLRSEARRRVYQQRREQHSWNIQRESQGQGTVSGMYGGEQDARAGEQQTKERETQGGGVQQEESHTARAGSVQGAMQQENEAAQDGEWLQGSSRAQNGAHSQDANQPPLHANGQGTLGRCRVWVQGSEGLWLEEGGQGVWSVPLSGSVNDPWNLNSSSSSSSSSRKGGEGRAPRQPVA